VKEVRVDELLAELLESKHKEENIAWDGEYHYLPDYEVNTDPD